MPKQLNQKLATKTAEEIILATAEIYKDKLSFASSLGAEDQIILDIICRHQLDIEIFTLDTGRLFPETIELLAESEKKYKRKIKIYFPEQQQVENMVNTKGINLFYDSIENRKECCQIRKVQPLNRALESCSAWLCGLRQDQSVTRASLQIAENDNSGKIKISPLYNWSENDVWNYIKTNNIPYNKLHDKNFRSIGCACCTRAVKKDEDVRNGRWWWEPQEQKECGLHIVNGKLQRINK